MAARRPTRAEQLELDELLSDIYRGIEELPDREREGARQVVVTGYGSYQPQNSRDRNQEAGERDRRFDYRVVKREYELPASSEEVQRHRKAIRESQQQQQQPQQEQQLPGQPQRSTLKRHTNTPTTWAAHQHEPTQSLASFVTSNEPASAATGGTARRRVRILEPRPANSSTWLKPSGNTDQFDSKYQSYGSQDYNNNVHELQPEATEEDEEDYNDAEQEPDEEDLDGVTRVEVYQGSWLDRQLGKASRRRSSKELNERQVKEKAMIEELKRSLKNGAITLRHSLRGPKSQRNQHQSFDDHALTRKGPGNKTTTTNTAANRDYHQLEGKPISSGLATVPRNYGRQKNTYNQTNNNDRQFVSLTKTTYTTNTNKTNQSQPQSRAYNQPQPQQQHQQQHKASVQQLEYEYNKQPRSTRAPLETQSYNRLGVSAPYGSTTLPHKLPHHQLLYQHQRGSAISPTATHSSETYNPVNPINNNTSFTNQQTAITTTTMTNGQRYNTYSPRGNKSPAGIQAETNGKETIATMPSATEVVRSALSRSNSQLNMNQLGKNLDLTPGSGAAPRGGAGTSQTLDGGLCNRNCSPMSPMSPTQHLRPTTPSLSPSPLAAGQANTMPHQHQHQDQNRPLGYIRTQQPSLTGTRVIPAPAVQQGEPAPRQQPVYANPHASLMQHRADQLSARPTAANQASIREFNELDSLLRSLSPAGVGPGSSQVQVRPAQATRPSPAQVGGYGAGGGFAAAPTYQPGDTYARIHKQPTQFYQPTIITNPNPQPNMQQQQQQHPTQSNKHPFVIDVTNLSNRENCPTSGKQNLSEFEPPMEMLPSMEDYQNIAKLNPVKNHFWYKPNMSRDRAIGLLKNKPQGTFIVRDSTSFKGAYGLAVKVARLPKNVLENASLRNPNGDPSAEFIRHFLIEPTSNGVRLKGYANEPVFGSLPNLIYQHSLTELALPCKLLIPRADIEDPNFNQKQKQFYDEFLASKELAKHQPYEITSPNGGYRKYPGDVYVHNEHRIIFE